MKLSKALQKFVDSAKTRDSYWIENAKLDFALALEKQRRLAGMSYAAIAEKLGTSAAYITKVFRGDANLTIETMVKLSRATGAKLSINLIDEKIDAKSWMWIGNITYLDAANHPILLTETVEVPQPELTIMGEARYG